MKRTCQICLVISFLSTLLSCVSPEGPLASDENWRWETMQQPTDQMHEEKIVPIFEHETVLSE